MDILEPCKKIEIIIESSELNKVREILEECGITSYTTIPNLSGKGHRGLRKEVEFTDIFKNSMVISVVPKEKVSAIVEKLKALFEDYAGALWVSDVEILSHPTTTNGKTIR